MKKIVWVLLVVPFLSTSMAFGSTATGIATGRLTEGVLSGRYSLASVIFAVIAFVGIFPILGSEESVPKKILQMVVWIGVWYMVLTCV